MLAIYHRLFYRSTTLSLTVCEPAPHRLPSSRTGRGGSVLITTGETIMKTYEEAVEEGKSVTTTEQCPDGIAFDGGIYFPSMWSGECGGDGTFYNSHTVWDD